MGAVGQAAGKAGEAARSYVGVVELATSAMRAFPAHARVQAAGLAILKCVSEPTHSKEQPPRGGVQRLAGEPEGATTPAEGLRSSVYNHGAQTI